MKKIAGKLFIMFFATLFVMGTIMLNPGGMIFAGGTGEFRVANYGTQEETGNFWYRGYIFEVTQETVVTHLISAVTDDGEATVVLYEAEKLGTTDGEGNPYINATQLLGYVSQVDGTGSEVTTNITAEGGGDTVTLSTGQLYLLAQTANNGNHVYVSELDITDLETHPRIKQGTWEPRVNRSIRWNGSGNQDFIGDQNHHHDYHGAMPKIGFLFQSNVTAPVVETLEVSQVTQNSAVLEGRLLDVGNAETTQYFEWGQCSNFSDGVLISKGSTSTPGSYSHELTNLEENQDYYYRAVGINEGGRSDGDTLSFTTQDLPETEKPSSIATSPSGNAAHGATITVSWSPSATEGAAYQLQRRYDGNLFNVIYDGTSKSYDHEVTDDETIETVQYRVKATKEGHNDSDWVVSETISLGSQPENPSDDNPPAGDAPTQDGSSGSARGYQILRAPEGKANAPVWSKNLNTTFHTRQEALSTAIQLASKEEQNAIHTLGTGNSDQDFIANMYHWFFSREPDQQGFDSWLQYLVGGGCRYEVYRNFILSQEFCLRYAGMDMPEMDTERGEGNDVDQQDKTLVKQTSHLSDQAFINHLYQHLLGREPDQEGFHHWLDHLQALRSRQRILQDFRSSIEYRLKNISLEKSPWHIKPCMEGSDTYFSWSFMNH